MSVKMKAEILTGLVVVVKCGVAISNRDGALIIVINFDVIIN